MEKKKTQLLSYGIASLVVAVIIITAIAINHSDLPYKLTPQEALDQLKNKDNFIDPMVTFDKAAPKTVFIDVRNPHDYAFNHLENAINIPAERILQEDYLENIREIEENDNTIILYGSVPQQVAGPWMLLKQVGISNLKMYAGTFDQLMSNEPVAASIYNEIPVIDTTALSKKVEPALKVSAPKAPAPKKEVVPLRVEPAPESGGGC